MGDDDKQIGIILGRLEGFVTRLESIEEGGMALCQLHSASLKSIETKIDNISKQPRPRTESSSSNSGVSYGKFKAYGTPAVIVSVVLALGALQYFHVNYVAEKVKGEAITEAATVAMKAARVDRKDMDRDEVRKVLLDMIRETQIKGTP